MEARQTLTKKIITVFGASDKQGRSVINRLLETSRHEFTLRGVVRKADGDSERVRRIAEQGVECQYVDYEDVRSLQDAVRGSYGVYAITEWWDRPEAAYQVQMGKNICDACLITGVQHLVWCSSPHSSKLSGAKMISIGNFDSKAEVEEYIEQRKPITGMVASYMHAGWFMNHVRESVHVDERGLPIYLSVWHADNVRVPLVDIEADNGKYVEGVFRAGRAADGARVRVVSEWLNPRQIADKMVMTQRETGEKVKVVHVQLTPAVFKSFVPRQAQELVMGIVTITAEYGFFGLGSEEKQSESDVYLGGATKTSWEGYIQRTGPWYWPEPEPSAPPNRSANPFKGKGQT